MVRDYWTRVHRTAFAQAARRIGLDTWERVVLNVLLVGAALAALLFWGSAEASRDELIVRITIAAGLILIFPLFYFRELVVTPARMEAEAREDASKRTAEYVASIERLGKDNETLKMKMSPEVILMSPRYLKLKFQLEPEIGNLSPKARLEVGLAELDKLTQEVINKNYESFYLAVHVGTWLRENARRYFGSSMNFQVIQKNITEKMDTIYDHFHQSIRG